MGISEGVIRLTDRLLAASFVLVLAAYGYLGWFSRYMADDYTIARLVKQHGLLGAQMSWYLGWTGRFSFTFVASLLGLIGPSTTRVLPALILTLWFVLTAWAIRQIRSLSTRTSWTRSALYAALIIWATLETAPNLVQSLYWQPGALTYIAPLVLLSLYVGVLSSATSETDRFLAHRFYLCCSGILTFVAGGFSDVYVVLQSCGLILILILLAFQRFAPAIRARKGKAFLLVGLCGSLLALAIDATAPGNSIRQAYFPQHLGMFAILQLTAMYSLRFFAKLVVTHPIVVVIVLTLPFLLVMRDHSRSVITGWDRQLCIRLLIMIPLAVFVLTACCTAPSFYAMSVMLPERSRILLGLIFACGAVLWSRAAGELLAAALPIDLGVKRIICMVSTMLLVLTSIHPLVSFVSIFEKRYQARAYAADWDREDSEIRAAKETGVQDVAVEQIGDFQFRLGKGDSDLHLRADPSFWINRETAKYYGLTSIRAKEDVPGSP